MINPLEESDKNYWHHYVGFYDKELAGLNCRSILEFGVWRGASIRWLMTRFPSATIYGADILAVQPSWPIGENVRYLQLDQADIGQVKDVFNKINTELDLVIEDGSHVPEHQRNCLVESISRIRSGGIYILEDIHTSHPKHPYYRKSKSLFKPLIGPLHLLLAVDHMKSCSDALRQKKIGELSVNSLFNRHQIQLLCEKIEMVSIFKRTTLPSRCFACGCADFDYAMLKCKCGVNLYAETDSMSALIRIK